MKKREYQFIDLFIWLLLLIGLEAACLLAVHKMEGVVFTVSVVLAVSVIVMMRWGAIGIAYAAIGGVIYCIGNGGDLSQYVTYAVGNAFIGLNLIWFRAYGKKLNKSAFLSVLFVLSGYVAICLGRATVGQFFGGEFFSVLVRFLAVESLSTFVAVVAILIARRQDGVFEDQNEYLKRISEKREQNG